MWALIKWLVLKLAVVRWLFKTLGGLAIFVPLALLLKTIGWPILLVLGVLALPVLFVLFIFGLPIFLVLVVGGMVMSFLFALLSFGLVVLKFAVLVVLPIYLLWRIACWLFRRPNGGTPRESSSDIGETGPSAPPATD